MVRSVHVLMKERTGRYVRALNSVWKLVVVGVTVIESFTRQL